jgi:hypothetical protein
MTKRKKIDVTDRVLESGLRQVRALHAVGAMDDATLEECEELCRTGMAKHTDPAPEAS